MSAPGKVLFLLHAHLPFVRHPEHSRFFEENWFFEALSETYIPLVQSLWRLLEKGVPGTLNLSVSPPLIEMLSDSHLIEKFSKHLYYQKELAEKELQRFSESAEGKLARFYAERLGALIDTWENRIKKDLLGEFLALERLGKLNLLTCVGTHPYLPAYQSDFASIHRQLAITVKCFERAFKRKPKGVWLPECGYFPGLDELLADYGFRYFFLETHGSLLATPPPKYGVFSPMQTKSGLFCLGREQKSSREVWSRETGYPGHPEYREFFKDIANERERSYLGEYFYSGETPIHTGLKYWRITGNENKALYKPWNANRLVSNHARTFIAEREGTFLDLIPRMEGNPATMLCPYDAELFGHWWFEGPLFLESMLEEAAGSSILEFVGADSVMENSADGELHSPAFSSWGEGGFGSVWINSETDFYYPMGKKMQLMFEALSKKRQTPFLKRLLKQFEREIMLFQSSDWAFMIHNHSAEGYARKRLEEHYSNACALFELGMSKTRDNGILASLEKKNNIFHWM